MAKIRDISWTDESENIYQLVDGLDNKGPYAARVAAVYPGWDMVDIKDKDKFPTRNEVKRIIMAGIAALKFLEQVCDEYNGRVVKHDSAVVTVAEAIMASLTIAGSPVRASQVEAAGDTPTVPFPRASS
jgi:hypothetical protein